MILIRTFLALLIVTIVSCNSSAKTTEENANDNTSEMKVEAMKMKEAGYTSGTIVYSDEEGDCPYTIQVDGEDNDYMFDPINLDESYKKDGMKIWFKYGGLRMMNRCVKANPVNILEIQERM
jgi:hypothetical protein